MQRPIISIDECETGNIQWGEQVIVPDKYAQTSRTRGDYVLSNGMKTYDIESG